MGKGKKKPQKEKGKKEKRITNPHNIDEFRVQLGLISSHRGENDQKREIINSTSACIGMFIKQYGTSFDDPKFESDLRLLVDVLQYDNQKPFDLFPCCFKRVKKQKGRLVLEFSLNDILLKLIDTDQQRYRDIIDRLITQLDKFIPPDIRSCILSSELAEKLENQIETDINTKLNKHLKFVKSIILNQSFKETNAKETLDPSFVKIFNTLLAPFLDKTVVFQKFVQNSTNPFTEECNINELAYLQPIPADVKSANFQLIQSFVDRTSHFDQFNRDLRKNISKLKESNDCDNERV